MLINTPLDLSYFLIFYLLIKPKIILCINKVPKLFLISFDGFRGDYIDKDLTPTLFKLSKNGVTGGHMKSLFITKTFPNHLSIVTGLYEETHGVVHNFMFDSVFNQTFDPHNTQEKWWDNNVSIPIWVSKHHDHV